MFDRITQNPNVLAGRATIRGLRISVAHVVNLVANGVTPAQIVADLPDLEEESAACRSSQGTVRRSGIWRADSGRRHAVRVRKLPIGRPDRC
jgi:hypothetical protein